MSEWVALKGHHYKIIPGTIHINLSNLMHIDVSGL